MVSWYVAHVFSEWFGNGSSRSNYYWYHPCFYIPHALYFYCMSLYFKIFSASFLITFLSPGFATSINMHVLSSLSRIIMSGLLLGIVLPVCTCWFHTIVTLPPWFVTTEFGTCSYQCFLSSCTPISLHMLKCICALTLSCRCTYCSFIYLYIIIIIHRRPNSFLEDDRRTIRR